MNKSELTAGVIGGLGPEATVDFMARVIALTPAENDQDHIRLLVDQNPKVPSRQDAILAGGADPAEALVTMAVRLESAGCDFLVMPCNAAHAYQDSIVAATGIPFIDIIAATVDALPAAVSSVGILETPGLRKFGLYQAASRSRGLSPISLDDSELEQLLAAVDEVKGGAHDAGTKAALQKLANALVARGAQAIILACTELPLVLHEGDAAVPLISSTEELARKTVALARGEQALPQLQ